MVGPIHSLKDVKVVRHEMNLEDRVINIIADPNIAYLSAHGRYTWPLHGVLSSRSDLPWCCRRHMFDFSVDFLASSSFQLRGACLDTSGSRS